MEKQLSPTELAELKSELAKFEAAKKKQNEYNKKYQAEHPKTEAQLATRKAYNKTYNNKKKLRKIEIYARARELNII